MCLRVYCSVSEGVFSLYASPVVPLCYKSLRKLLSSQLLPVGTGLTGLSASPLTYLTVTLMCSQHVPIYCPAASLDLLTSALSGYKNILVMNVKFVYFPYIMYVRFMQHFIVQDIAVTLLLLTQPAHNSSLYPKICTKVAVMRKFSKL
jgi:hypothetical protein